MSPPGLTFCTSRSTTSPLRQPMPGSITSAPFVPTTMPTLGTMPTLKSGMTYTCSDSFTVAPSRW